VKKPLFISWIGFQRRVASIDQALDFDVLYVPPPFQSKWLKPLGYAAQALRTAVAVLARRPSVIWAQSPPTFLPHLLLALRPVAGRYRIVADCHQSVFDPPWTGVPGAVAAMNRCDVVLVHNAESRPAAEALGVEPGRILVLEDPPPLLEAPEPGRAPDPAAPPYVLTPCSFSADEPIPVLLDAARLLPELRILITGSRRKAEGLGFLRDKPANVRFTDYLPLPEFERLLTEASVVLGLTSVEGVQLSVANEALGANRALVLSDTRILRAMFGEAALFAQNTPEDIAAQLTQAVARRAELETRSAALKTRRRQDWRAAADAVTAKVL
jgi:glycosyltransferase involved in cell wall biosynthesis